jgi:multicomponent Na+:H+ antiporter subunit F
MAAVALVMVTAAMAVILVRALRGPTIQDRILAVNTFGTTTVLWLALYASDAGAGDVVDIAMIYALTSFVATIAMLKYVERGDLGADPGEEDAP